MQNGAQYIERADKLVQLIAHQKGLSNPAIDAQVALVDERLAAAMKARGGEEELSPAGRGVHLLREAFRWIAGWPAMTDTFADALPIENRAGEIGDISGRGMAPDTLVFSIASSVSAGPGWRCLDIGCGPGVLHAPAELTGGPVDTWSARHGR